MYAATRSPSDELRELAAKLYREKRPYLLSIARHNAIGDADAEEALQEAFASFIRHFDPDAGAPPMAWLTLYADLCVMPTQFWHPASEADRVLERSA
jgi:DNA-directed RNA polymerase specialized sigma24 family protein